jgi:hypothetical protein
MTHSSKYKDYFCRQQLKKYQKKILILKYLIKNTNFSKSFRFKLMLKMQLLRQKNLKNKIKNRCMFTSKVRSVSRLSNLTKASFKSSIN